mmetsp:Transcript_31336/g.37285  ORF Transcript_31336/g.37285 Transcript_31336/m.37285 type:complete len:207 (+) Transcript_31336:603-1223(+)
MSSPHSKFVACLKSTESSLSRLALHANARDFSNALSNIVTSRLPVLHAKSSNIIERILWRQYEAMHRNFSGRINCRKRNLEFVSFSSEGSCLFVTRVNAEDGLDSVDMWALPVSYVGPYIIAPESSFTTLILTSERRSSLYLSTLFPTILPSPYSVETLYFSSDFVPSSSVHFDTESNRVFARTSSVCNIVSISRFLEMVSARLRQ